MPDAATETLIPFPRSARPDRAGAARRSVALLRAVNNLLGKTVRLCSASRRALAAAAPRPGARPLFDRAEAARVDASEAVGEVLDALGDAGAGQPERRVPADDGPAAGRR